MLTPLGVGPGQPFPYISPLSLSLGVLARDPDSGEERFARVKVPEQLPRFVAVGEGAAAAAARGRDRPLPRLALPRHGDRSSARCFRVTRDADIELSDDADDLLEAVQAEIRRRRFGDVVRVEVASSMSAAMLDELRSGLARRRRRDLPVHGMLDLVRGDADRRSSTAPS